MFCLLVVLSRSERAQLLSAGHIGFLGRSGVFLFVAILMFRTIANPDINNTDETTIGNALSQLQKTNAGRACLFILGFFLVVYGTFAVSLENLLSSTALVLGLKICLSGQHANSSLTIA